LKIVTQCVVTLPCIFILHQYLLEAGMVNSMSQWIRMLRRPIVRRLTLLCILKADQALRVLDFPAHFCLFSVIINQEITERSDSEESSSATSIESAAAIVPSGKQPSRVTCNIKHKKTINLDKSTKRTLPSSSSRDTKLLKINTLESE